MFSQLLYTLIDVKIKLIFINKILKILSVMINLFYNIIKLYNNFLEDICKQLLNKYIDYQFIRKKIFQTKKRFISTHGGFFWRFDSFA